MSITPRYVRNRLALVGSAIALCCASIQSASGNAFSGDGLLVSGETIQDYYLTIDSNVGAIAGGDGATEVSGGNGIFLHAINTIDRVAINNLLSVKGGAGGSGMFSGRPGGHGIVFQANSDVTNVQIDNSGLILGGAGGKSSTRGGIGGNGLFLTSTFADADPSFVTTTNTGNIFGGAGGNGAAIGSGGNGGHAIVFQAAMLIDNVNFLNANSAVIQGGIGGTGIPNGGMGGHGIYLSNSRGIQPAIPQIQALVAIPTGTLKNVAVDNAGSIVGGDGGKGAYGDGVSLGKNSGTGGDAGHAIFLEGNGIDGVTITNSSTGEMLGGEGGYGSNGGAGGWGGDALRIVSSGQSVKNVQVTNSSRMIGGEGGDAGLDSDGRGGAGGNGIQIRFGVPVVNGLNGPMFDLMPGNGFHNTNVIDGFNLDNQANASLVGGDGGYGDGQGGAGGHGIAMSAAEIKNGTITNFGNIIAGSGGNSAKSGGKGGIGIDLNAALPTTLENITIFNADSGVVKGGNAGSGSVESHSDGGHAISVQGPASKNLLVVNYGLIKGGDAFGTGVPGMGINATGDLSGVVIDNWGSIAAGAGTNPIAINIIGGNNVLNLNGHSEVLGKINAKQGRASTDGNVLNINFTGVSAEERARLDAALAAALAAQGLVPGQEADLTFTFRGVTYVIDPMVINLATTSYQQQGLTPNQQAIGASLDSFKVNPTGDMLAMLNAIDVSGNVPLALEGFSPQRYQLFTDIALSNSNFTTQEIDHRLDNRRRGSETIDASRFQLSASSIEQQLGLSTQAGRSGLSNNSPSKQAMSSSNDRPWGAFLSGIAVSGDIGGRAGVGDAEFTTVSVLVGVDGKVNDSLMAGVLFGYNHTDADLDSFGGQADVDTFTTGLYAGWNKGPYYVNGLATYSYNDYDSRRPVVFPGFSRAATGDTSANQITLNIDGGYDYVVNETFTAGPLLGLQYVNLDVDAFNETGAGAANLSVGKQDMDSLRSRLGFRLNFHKENSPSVRLAANVRVAWQHEFLDDSHDITGVLANSGLTPFTVQTAKMGRDAALIGVGVNGTYREYLTLFLDYDTQIGGSGDVLQSIRGGLKMAF